MICSRAIQLNTRKNRLEEGRDGHNLGEEFLQERWEIPSLAQGAIGLPSPPPPPPKSSLRSKE